MGKSTVAGMFANFGVPVFDADDAVRDFYAGDGVYVGHDCHQLILYTERENGEHWIALEPEVLAVIIRYADKLSAISRDRNE